VLERDNRLETINIWGETGLIQKCSGFFYKLKPYRFSRSIYRRLNLLIADLQKRSNFWAGDILADIYCGRRYFWHRHWEKIVKKRSLLKATRKNTKMIEENLKLNKIKDFAIYLPKQPRQYHY